MYEGAPDFPQPDRFWRLDREVPRQHLLHFAHGDPRLHPAGRPVARTRTIFRACGCSARSASRSIRPPGSGTTGSSARSAAPSSIPGGRPKPGSIMIAPMPGAVPAKPGSGTLPMPGILAEVVDLDGNPVGANQEGFLIIQRPWPSMLRTLWRDPERYQQPVLGAHPGRLLHRRRRAPRRGRLLLDAGPRRRRDERQRPPAEHHGGRIRAGAPSGRGRGGGRRQAARDHRPGRGLPS